MKAKRLDELQVLLGSDAFATWWAEVSQVREALSETSRRYEDTLAQATLAEFRAELAQKNGIDTLYGSGDDEDAAARLLAEAATVENRSIEAVGAYEDQRFHASDAWIRLGAVEKTVEEARERVAAARAKGPAGEAEAKRLEAEMTPAVREHRAAHEAYERESARKNRLWEEVEGMWARSLELSLLHAEKKAKAQRVKREAEQLFGAAEASKQRAEALTREGEDLSTSREGLTRRLEGLFRHARDVFDCVAGDDFLYWGARENDKLAYCVPLIGDDGGHYNMEIEPLQVYKVTARDGVGRLEPLPPEGLDPEDGDRRIESYFIQDRRGQPAGGT